MNLATWIDRRTSSSDEAGSLELLRTAQQLVQGGDLDKERERARRSIELASREIEELGKRSLEISDTQERYFLLEALHASAVGNCDLPVRNAISMRLVGVGVTAGRRQPVRRGGADFLEGMWIAREFYTVHEEQATRAERAVHGTWEKLQQETTTSSHILDPSTADPAQGWLQEMIWNLDEKQNAGLAGQSDAMLRLGVRLRHWRDTRHEEIADAVERLEVACESLRSDQPWLRIRCLVAVGDALLELGEWELAARVHRDWRRKPEGTGKDPFALHSMVQEAYATCMAGDAAGGKAQLEKIDRKLVEAAAGVFLTSVGEQARYEALQQLCRTRQGGAKEKATIERIRELLQRTSVILSAGTGRASHLHTLFFGTLVRDVNRMLETRPNLGH